MKIIQRIQKWWDKRIYKIIVSSGDKYRYPADPVTPESIKEVQQIHKDYRV